MGLYNFCTVSGEIIWRKVLEKGDRGSVNAICSYGSSIFAITGSDVVLVRGWDAKHGYLSYHWSTQYTPIRCDVLVFFLYS